MDSYLQQLVAKRSDMMAPSSLMNMAQGQAVPDMSQQAPSPDQMQMAQSQDPQSQMMQQEPQQQQQMPQQMMPQQPPPSVSGATEMAHGWKGLLANFMQGMGDAMLHQAGLPTSYEKQVYAQKVADQSAQDDFNNHMTMAALQEKIRENMSTEGLRQDQLKTQNMIDALRIDSENRRADASLKERQQQHQDSNDLKAASQAETVSRDKQTAALGFASLQERIQAHKDAMLQIESNKGTQLVYPDPVTKQAKLGFFKPGDDVPDNAVTPQEYAKSHTPPAEEINRAIKAHNQIPLMDQAVKEAESLDKQGKLGPAVGRLNDFMRGKVGSADPEYTKFNTRNQLLQTAAMIVHTSRTSNAVLTKFANLFDAGKMDVDTYKAAIIPLRELMVQYSHGADLPGFKPRFGGGDATGTQPAGTPEAPAPKAVYYDMQGNRIQR